MTLGNDNGTDGQTDRQNATQYAAPPREEGRIITDAQRQSELFVQELMDLREHSSILRNGMTLLRSEIDSLIASVCCT